MKRFWACLMIAALLLQGYGRYSLEEDGILGETEQATLLSAEQGTVISAELKEVFENETDESAVYPVMIWLEDIDYDEVWQTAEAKAAVTWEELEAREERIYAEAVSEAVNAEAASTYSLLSAEEAALAAYNNIFSLAGDEIGMIQEDVDTLVAAEREAARDFYEKQNQVLAENERIADNVQFVSRYAPMIIAELTQEQIEEIAKNDMVTGIYAAEEEEIAEETEEVTAAASNLASDDENYTAYLDYLGAATAHKVGLSGAGVKVGLIDSKRVVNADHNELADSNITAVGSAGSTYTHAVDMARVICGEYGMAPDCELYSVYRSEGGTVFYSAIELLLDQGVSVISMSVSISGGADTPVYSAMDMWFDHISASHSVILVKSAGNSVSDNKTISKPGLAYNVITVANVNCLTDTIVDTSRYENGTCAQKPDVASAGAYVLGMAGGGTSAATATVSGMIALLLEAKPTLAGAPHIIKAIVIASADHIAGSSTYASGYDEKQGAGVVNVLRALTIISRGQYYGNYTHSDGTITLRKSVISGNAVSTFVFVGTKMNIVTGSHTSGECDNQDMPELRLAVVTSTGTLIGYSNMTNSSVELARGNYSSSVILNLVVADIGSRGLPYAAAWY